MKKEQVYINDETRVDRIKEFSVGVKFVYIDGEHLCSFDFSEEIITYQNTVQELSVEALQLYQEHGDNMLYYIKEKATQMMRQKLLKCEAFFKDEQKYFDNVDNHELIRVNDDLSIDAVQTDKIHGS